MEMEERAFALVVFVHCGEELLAKTMQVFGD